MKTIQCSLILSIVALCQSSWADAILIQDDFTGTAGSAPNPAEFQSGGPTNLNGSGVLNLSTTGGVTSWVKTIDSATPTACQTVALQFRGYAYAEAHWNPGVYGNGQPRGLRIGSDDNNVIEFYSVSRTLIGIRTRANGVESTADYAVSSVYDWHDYEITVSPGAAVFKVDGTTAATLTTNLPTGALNAYFTTSGPQNVPISLESLTLVLNCSDYVLVQDDFTGTAGSAPNPAEFQSGGPTNLNGSGELNLNTTGDVTSWVKTIDSATPTSCQTVALQFRGYAYAEAHWNPGVYGNGQPRGLRVGSDDNNVIEFYSVSRTLIGIRTRANGVESTANYAVSSVHDWHDYEITVSPGAAVFKVDGTTAATLTTNLPTGALNAYFSTSGPQNVPISLENLKFSIQSPSTFVTSFTPTSGPVGTSVTITGRDFTGAAMVKFGGVDATSFTVDFPTQITASVPVGAVTGAISVTTPGGTVLSVERFVAGAVFVEDMFDGTAGTLPDGDLWLWGGEVNHNGSGTLNLQTWSENRSWLRSKAAATPATGQTIKLFTRAFVYAENWDPGIYGGGQPRGLRVGADDDNVVEFYSVSRTRVGMRTRSLGIESSLTVDLPSGVDSQHDYEISVTPSVAIFRIDGVQVGAISANIPAGALNAHVSTFDDYTMNVPVTLERVVMSIEAPPPVVSGFSPGSGSVGTSVTITGSNFVNATAVSFGGVTAASFIVDSNTQITSTVPTNAVTGPIGVTAPGGTAWSSNPFTLLVYLTQDEFNGVQGAFPDATKWLWDGEVSHNDSGTINLQTWSTNRSYLRSKAAVAVADGRTITLQLRAYAYAESWNPGIYGGGQPRGLRVGTDDNNVVEFYSISRTIVGMRVRRQGIESFSTHTLPSGVNSMHDYEITVTPSQATFMIDGVLAGSFSSNIPTGALNIHISTFDDYFGNVPVGLERVSLIVDGQTFASWKSSQFTLAQLADPAISGDQADPAHDGITNLMKYALGLDPLACGSGNMPTPGEDSGYLTLTFRRNKLAMGIVFKVEAGDNLGGWGGTGAEVSRTDGGDCWIISVRDSVPISASRQRFMRLRVNTN
jgi:hypothetical protein